MKLKALLLTMLVAGIATSIAIASPPGDKGRRGETGTTATKAAKKAEKQQRKADRRPVVMLMLKGEFVSAGSDSFAMLVKHSNKHARALRGKQVTLKVDGKTKFRRSGPAKLSDLAAGDRLHVLVRAKKGEDALELLARLVHARPAKPAKDDADGETTTSGTTTSGTTTSSTTTTSAG